MASTLVMVEPSQFFDSGSKLLVTHGWYHRAPTSVDPEFLSQEWPRLPRQDFTEAPVASTATTRSSFQPGVASNDPGLPIETW